MRNVAWSEKIPTNHVAFFLLVAALALNLAEDRKALTARKAKP